MSKKLIELIQKRAQAAKGAPPPPPPSPPSSAPKTVGLNVPDAPGVTPVGGRPTPVGRGLPTSTQIRAMQTAIQKLAQTISSTIDYNSLKAGLSQPPSDKKKYEVSYGRDAFSNFMVNRFLRSSKVKGVEYNIDPTQQKMEQKSADTSDLKAMFIVLDSLNRIGKEKTESLVDGNWGPRTNNALKNSAAIADSVMRLGKELGMDTGSVDVNKIGELGTLIPEDNKDISFEEKVKRAPHITQILNSVMSLFSSFRNDVLQDPTYANMIMGRKPLFSVSPEKPAINPAEAEKVVSPFANYPGANFTITIPPEYAKLAPQVADANKAKSINAINLLTPQNFEQWANNTELNYLKQSNPETYTNLVKIILKQVKDQIAQKLSGAAPAPTGAERF